MNDPIQPTLAFAEEMMRMRISYATKTPERPVQDAWVVFMRYLAANGDVYYRCYLFSHPTHREISYRLSDAGGEFNKETLIEQLRGAKRWKDEAKNLWIKKFGSLVEPSMKTTEQPEDPQPVDEKELLTAWKDPHKDLSDPQLHDLAALIQNEVGSKQPPEIDLLQKMRRCRIVERRYGCSALNAWLKWAQDHVEALYGHEDRWLSAPMLFDLTIPSRLRQCVDESMARRALSGEDLVQGFVEGEIWL